MSSGSQRWNRSITSGWTPTDSQAAMAYASSSCIVPRATTVKAAPNPVGAARPTPHSGHGWLPSSRRSSGSAADAVPTGTSLRSRSRHASKRAHGIARPASGRGPTRARCDRSDATIGSARATRSALRAWRTCRPGGSACCPMRPEPRVGPGTPSLPKRTQSRPVVTRSSGFTRTGRASKTAPCSRCPR